GRRRQDLSRRRGRRRGRARGREAVEADQGEQHGQLRLRHAGGGERSAVHHEPQRAVGARQLPGHRQLSAAAETVLDSRRRQVRAELDAWVREVIAWPFAPATGTPFWLDFAARAGWDPRREIGGFDDLRRFGLFEDEWLRGGPVQRWVPKG